MTGDRLARASLRLDAVYCLVLAALVGGSAPMTASQVGIPIPLLICLSVATAVWGAYVWHASNTSLRASARLVMVANLVASSGLAATGLVAEMTVVALAALVLAVDVAAFAISQGIALRLMPRPAA